MRNFKIDIVKAIGVLVVAMGHINPEPIGYGLISYFYTFNVPLFFIVSGYLPSETSGSIIEKVKSKFKTIMTPYVILFLISLIYGHVIVRLVFQEYVVNFEFLETLKALVFASEWLNHVPTFNFALRFLPTFFITQSIFLLIRKVSHFKFYLFTILAALVPLSAYIQFQFPGRPILGLNVIPAGVAFMCIGKLLALYEENLIRNRRTVLTLATISSLYCGVFVLGNIQAIPSPIYFLGATGSVILIYSLATQFTSASKLTWLEQHSLYFYGLHSLVANVFSYFSKSVGLGQVASGALFWLINFAFISFGAVLASKALIWALSRIRTIRNYSQG